MNYKTLLIALMLLLSFNSLSAQPKLLDDQFVLPEGFHIYKAANRDLTGGSYDLTFDGKNRLLVGDGNAVRRLTDTDGDGVYDKHQTIASGRPTSGRGPQGLLVYGDYLYVVAGDGVQLFKGASGDEPLKFVRRLGEKFNTGGDHAAHTILRGLDGYIYLVSGDGGGVGGRRHITEKSSPNQEERNASVFRFDPTGEQWECIGSGGRNPPSLGMNYLGEFFSFDSDMEFHVDVPFYRPVRLNHWATGADLGWQGVGAYPPYYIDTIPGIYDVGRGSPNWGIFYEHHSFPQKYRNAFIVCDYRWKSATSGRYATSGRLVAFNLKRDGATWSTGFEEFAKAKPGAKDHQGNSINFALVDVDVAPDGSIFITDHNQGIWRIFYDPSKSPSIPPIVPKLPTLRSRDTTEVLAELLTLPQPASEWSRIREEKCLQRLGSTATEKLMGVATSNQSIRMKLRAIRLLAPQFATLKISFIKELLKDSSPEIRGQGAWLLGIKKQPEVSSILVKLLNDPSAFVKKRALEGLMRNPSKDSIPHLLDLLKHKTLHVRHAATIALAHQPIEEVVKENSRLNDPQSFMRVLLAGHIRKERPPEEFSISTVKWILGQKSLSDQDHLNLLRILSLYRGDLESDRELFKIIQAWIAVHFPHKNKNIQWEQARLIGEFKVTSAFPQLVKALVKEKDYVTQFHFASALSNLPPNPLNRDLKMERKLSEWLIGTQSGWFTEYAGKGLQFPQFWNTVLNKLGQIHSGALAQHLDQLPPGSTLAKIVFSNVGDIPSMDRILIEKYHKSSSIDNKINLLGLISRIQTQISSSFALEEYQKADHPKLKKALLLALAEMGAPPEAGHVFLSAILEVQDDLEVLQAVTEGLLLTGEKLESYRQVNSLQSADLKGQQAVYFRLLDLMVAHPKLIPLIDQTLGVLSGTSLNSSSNPRVIWSSDRQQEGDQAWFLKEFDVPNTVKKAELIITCDNEYTAYLNGKAISESKDWTQPKRINLNQRLLKGMNLLGIHGINQGGPAGLMAIINWQTEDGKTGSIVSDTSWKFSRKPAPNWMNTGTSKGKWQLSRDVSGPTENVINVFQPFLKAQSENPELVVQEKWHKWYLTKYKEPFVAKASQNPKRSDAEIHKYILNLKDYKGNVAKGRAAYLKAGCYACHGGIKEKKTTIFGPALNGVMLRLKRQELADAIVYPSKQVVERFKASVLVTSEGQSLQGFITENSEDFVSITDLENNVTRLPRSKVLAIRTEDTSLMPKELLSRFSDEDIRNLLTFLSSLK